MVREEKLGVIIEPMDENSWSVRDDRSGYKVGEIKWFAGFGRYCLFPTLCILPPEYQEQVLAFCKKLQEKRKGE